MIGMKEILWEEIDPSLLYEMTGHVYSHTNVFTSGISFGCCDLKINVQYDNPEFRGLLEEKFDLTDPYPDAPRLIFVKYKKSYGFKLPYDQYGYISENKRVALVFALSFGVFKSVISGYASLCVEHLGYIPVHGSVFSVDKTGIILTGGTLAGKTTTLLNLVEVAITAGRDVRILTDDWAIVSRSGDSYIAKTFDNSISLRERDIDCSQKFRFCQSSDLVETIRKKSKVSLKPEALYSMPVGAEAIRFDIVILLKPEVGPAELESVGGDEFAEEVTDAAYHYPYISHDQIEMHKAFWKGVVANLKSFAFSTRPIGGGVQDVEKIRRLLM